MVVIQQDKEKKNRFRFMYPYYIPEISFDIYPEVLPILNQILGNKKKKIEEKDRLNMYIYLANLIHFNEPIAICKDPNTFVRITNNVHAYRTAMRAYNTLLKNDIIKIVMKGHINKGFEFGSSTIIDKGNNFVKKFSHIKSRDLLIDESMCSHVIYNDLPRKQRRSKRKK